jgi:phage shock protein A
MGFRWFRRREPPAPDPIAAYDDLVSDLESEAAELRRAAATLLTARARLGRELGQAEQAARQLRTRAAQSAAAKGRSTSPTRPADEARVSGQADAAAAEVLVRDAQRLERQSEGLREALAQTEGDVEQLKEAATRVTSQVEQLRNERELARARFTAGTALTAEAMRSRSDRVRRLVAVDAARDEVERAHALAEVWREEAQS